MAKIYCVGNSLLKEDRMPLKIMKKLQNKFKAHEFLELDPSENMPEESVLNIIDTVIGIDEVKIITDINMITTGKVYSLHNFDLGFTLKLMKKAGRIKKINIIGIPAHFKESRAVAEVTSNINKLTE